MNNFLIRNFSLFCFGFRMYGCLLTLTVLILLLADEMDAEKSYKVSLETRYTETTQ